MSKALLAKAEKEISSSKSSKKNLEYKNFLKTFYSNVPKDDYAMMAPENLAFTTLRHLELSHSRKVGDAPAISIYTPQADKDGFDAGRTFIDIVNDDMAFLVDSTVAELVRQGFQIAVFIHPILHVTHDESGKINEISSSAVEGKTKAQSHIHVELTRSLNDVQSKALKRDILRVLKDTRLANRDWRPIRAKLKEAQGALETAPSKYNKKIIKEYQEFLDYLHDDNFTLLGYREYKLSKTKDGYKSKVVKNSSLGLLSDEVEPVYINDSCHSLDDKKQKIRFEQDPMIITKVNKHSTVHRAVALDAVTVKKYDSKGEASGEILFIGLFTSVTYSRSVMSIPYIRMKVANVIKKSDFENASHNHKTIRHILEKYPRDEILQMPERLLFNHANSIVRLQEKPNIALYTRTDPFQRYISCLVYVPRERYETRLRLKFQDIFVKELGGECVSFKVSQDDSPLARVLFFIDINHLNEAPKFDADKLEKKLIEAGINWADKLKDIIEERTEDDDEAANLVSRFGHAFGVSYREEYSPVQALMDIGKIDQILGGQNIELEIYEQANGDEIETRIKLYRANTPLALSDVLPIMENMGLNVITEFPSEVQPSDSDDIIWIHDFMVEPALKGQALDIAKAKESFEDVFKKTWNVEMENDGLNRLALYSQLPWHDIAILRCYLHYLRQTGAAYSLPYMEDAITSYPDVAKAMVTFFKDLFNPKTKSLSEKQKESRRHKIYTLLEQVDNLDHDKIFRNIINIIDSTLRTNFYQKDGNGNPKIYLSIKLHSANIVGLPKPYPYREIFVYSARVEGVHLRGDKIARGGLRWSDRHEDFRTEVLGLMKAQQVKNAVIIPMGAKGGFVVKNPPSDGGRDAFRAEGIECYKIFIRGLLDITDNRKGEKIIHPEDVMFYDEPDPYLVVAADKGTATFSDIANGLSEEYGFWLGDAFASGGSAGYDHKEMGITARGAWESVKRHFREMDFDCQKNDFDVIGVGDMGGDVFGNGMLLSKHICLVGAFNHLHIFCDPTPNSATSYKERKRLFENVKGWDHYNKSVLSKGGRIFSRKDKSLKLTPQIQKRFNIEEKEVNPNVLIRAMLKSQADLMWFGGIGTYVKATSEKHSDVGDKGSDLLRIDAPELKVKVIGEGANLAMTQLARIEYAQNDGKLYADYIDNAGGVASSDDEVNIKILLNEVMRKSKYKMDIKKRNKLLESMTEDVSNHVLRGNYQQAQGISLMALQSDNNIEAHGQLIRYLKKQVGLSRSLEKLPSQSEIDRRRKVGQGLSRPELSVLQSYAKICYTGLLLNSDIVKAKAMEERLLRYFPEKLGKKYEKEILNHRLRNEIIATTLANGIVNRMGPDFIRDRMNNCGVSAEDVARAYIIVREAFGLRDIWTQIESLDGKVPAAVQLEALSETARMVERAVTWFLTRYSRKLDINRDIDAFDDGIEAVRNHMQDVVPAELLDKIKSLSKNGVANGLPKALAHNISLMPILGSACDIIRISMDYDYEIPLTARVYFEIGDYFHLDWMRQTARQMPEEGEYASQAIEGIVDQLYTCQAALTVRILKEMNKEINESRQKGKNEIGCIGCDSILKTWIKERGSQAELVEALFCEYRHAPKVDLSMLIIAKQRLRNLSGL